MKRPTILLNPGPVTLSERVRAALAREDLCHREPEFAELSLDLRRGLEGVYPAARGRFRAVLLSGSGTCAVEAMLASLVPRSGKVLVVANGVYGERMAAMVRAHGRGLALARAEWRAPMDLAAAEHALAADAGITHVAAVHHETTTGRLNDVAALAELCRRHQRPLLLDAVSSFAGETLDFERWPLAAVAATANKCLHAVPGVCFVLVDERQLAQPKRDAPSVYLDLFRYVEPQRDGFSPFTQAVHACFALQEALRELAKQGGWQARHARYRALTGRIRSALAELGVEPLLAPSESSALLTAYRLPAGHTYAALHDALKAAGFVIYAGQGNLGDAIFRIAVMGDLRDADVDRLLEAFAAVLS
jgi:2-aminoethylphosphonate-pyruvate transaminase